MLPHLLLGLTLSLGQSQNLWGNPAGDPPLILPVTISLGQPQVNEAAARDGPLLMATPTISLVETQEPKLPVASAPLLLPPPTISLGDTRLIQTTAPTGPTQIAPATHSDGVQETAKKNPATADSGKEDVSSEPNYDSESNSSNSSDAPAEKRSGFFFTRLFKAYVDEFKKKDDQEEEQPERPRRALPAPLQSPPMPSGEWQGYPLIGVPYDDTVYPLMKAIYDGPFGDRFKESRIKIYGWVTASGNYSTAKDSNIPTSYWIVPNRFELDQLILRVERQVDSVQTDHIDIGFRSTLLYGIDYRYMTAGGWFSQQLLKDNRLYGADPTEQYFDVYIPNVAQGLILRVGRWIACPDIETQFAPDNYLGSHSILFTYDTYTQTGVMATMMLNQQWMVQAGIHAGTDMAPWYKGAIPTGIFGVRWVSKDNNDSIYLVLNDINNAKFRHFQEDGQPAGHDNFNYPVVTWQHKFNDNIHTKTEAYYMWQFDAELGGTPSLGLTQPFAAAGGDNPLLPGLSQAYGVLNYTMFQLSKKDFVTVRNEWWKDERGMRSGTPGNYTSHTIGLSHSFNSVLQIRPEIGYYRNWTNPAFDNGNANGIWLYGLDMTLRF